MPFRYKAIVHSLRPGRGTGLTSSMRAEVLRQAIMEFYHTLRRKVRTRGNRQWAAAKWRVDKPVLEGIDDRRFWEVLNAGQVTGVLQARQTSRGNDPRYRYDIQMVHSSGPHVITPKQAKVLYVPYSDRARKVTATVAMRNYFAGRWVMGRIQKDGWHGYRYNPSEESGEDTGETPDFFFLPRVRLSRRSLSLTDREIGEIQRAVAGALPRIARGWRLEILNES